MNALINALSGKKTYIGLILTALGAIGIKTSADEVYGLWQNIDTLVTVSGLVIATFGRWARERRG